MGVSGVGFEPSTSIFNHLQEITWKLFGHRGAVRNISITRLCLEEGREGERVRMIRSNLVGCGMTEDTGDMDSRHQGRSIDSQYCRIII